MKTPLLLLGLALACALWAPAAEASTIFRTQNNLSLSQGLVGWWNFDGKTVSGTRVFDASGQGNYGTMTNGPTITEGKLGQGMAFDGGDDYVDVGDINAVDGASALTIIGWAKQNVLDVKAGIFGKGTDGQNDTQLETWDDGNMYLQLHQGGAHEAYFDYSTVVSPNTWFHFAAVFDGSGADNAARAKIYINGVRQSLSFSGTIAATVYDSGTASAFIGRFKEDARDISWNGLLDDVRIYNRALSADEVKRLYKIGATAKLGVTANNSSLSQGLVGWWNFDGKTVSGTRVFDASGNGNYGTMTNGPAITEGKLGQGMGFDGGDDYVDTNATVGNFGTSDFTVSYWVKTPVANNTEFIFAKRDVCAHTSFWNIVINSQGTTGIELDQDGSGTNYKEVDSNARVDNNVWHHVSFVRIGATLSVYIDGVFDTSGSGAGTVNISSAATLIMGRGTLAGGSCGKQFIGLLDDVRIYNRALSADEIKRLYNLGSTMKLNASMSNNKDSLAKGLVGWWTFDGKDVSGVQVYDKSGNNNRGIMTNGPTITEGKLGQGLSFDGGDDYVDISDNSVFDLSASGKYTWTGWMKPASFKEWNAMIGQYQSSSAYFVIYAGHTTTAADFGPVTAGISAGWRSSASDAVMVHSTNNVVNIGVWYYVAVTYDSSLAQSSRLTIYVNGTNVTDTTDIFSIGGPLGNIAPIAGAINVGRDGNFGDVAQSTLDDVRIYNRALSADEIKRLYNMGR